LTEKERDLAVDLAVEAGVAYVKNASSGAVEVASPESIRYLKERVPDTVGVKASGGIKSLEHAQSLLVAGADMLGTSAGIAIVSGVSAPQAVSY
jgi:deoxyribose-phosphate aldolase